MQWFNKPIILEGEKVKLVPLEAAHYDGLIAAAKNEDIWTYFSIDGREEEQLRTFLDTALEQRSLHLHYPFTVFNKANGNIIGTTRLGNINEKARSLEIGWTWYNPEYWSKGYNEECKLLLLTHCFDELNAVRVYLKTWEKNMRSRKAIMRIGAKFEGIIRNEFILPSTLRNSAYFSIIPEEWKQVRSALQQMIADKYAAHVR